MLNRGSISSDVTFEAFTGRDNAVFYIGNETRPLFGNLTHIEGRHYGWYQGFNKFFELMLQDGKILQIQVTKLTFYAQVHRFQFFCTDSNFFK
jgi:hypothetical protein